MKETVVIIEVLTRGKKRYFFEFNKHNRLITSWHWCYSKTFLLYSDLPNLDYENTIHLLAEKNYKFNVLELSREL